MMIPIRRFMPDALAAVLRKAPLTPEKIAFAWRTAVGPSVDRATSVELTGSTLRVRAKDAQWRREIEHSAGLIRARLDALLGAGVVRGLDVTVD
jgi:Dna[CI] antecedent, DciA